MRTPCKPRLRGPLVAALGLIVITAGCDATDGMPAQGSVSLPKKDSVATAEPAKGGAPKSAPKGGRARVTD